MKPIVSEQVIRAAASTAAPLAFMVAPNGTGGFAALAVIGPRDAVGADGVIRGPALLICHTEREYDTRRAAERHVERRYAGESAETVIEDAMAREAEAVAELCEREDAYVVYA